MIANEYIDSILHLGVPRMLRKLEIEKTYDHVNWGFLLYMLKQCGFGNKWCKWTQCYISIVSFSILVNGTLKGYFRSSRGLKQGDSLSQLLFIIVMKAFQ